MHASLPALPNPDPVSRHVHFFCSRSHGIAVELVLSVPGRASVPFSAPSSACKAFTTATGALVLARAITCVCAAMLCDGATAHMFVCRSKTATHSQWQVIRGSVGRGD